MVHLAKVLGGARVHRIQSLFGLMRSTIGRFRYKKSAEGNDITYAPEVVCGGLNGLSRKTETHGEFKVGKEGRVEARSEEE